MRERLRFDPAEAAGAGIADAQALLLELLDTEDVGRRAGLLNDALAEIVGLAAEHRLEECCARLSAFCTVLGPYVLPASRLSDAAVTWPPGKSRRGAELSPFCLRTRPALRPLWRARLQGNVLAELQAAHRIIRNALTVMTTAQKLEWGRLNERDGVDGEGITRANERVAVFSAVAEVPEADVVESEGGHL